MAQDKNYINGIYVKEFGQYSKLNVSVKLDQFIEELQKLPINDKGYVKLIIEKRKTPDKYNNTHSVIENDWKPDEKKERPINDDIKIEDLPF